MVALSVAETSVPWLMAVRKLGGVTRSSPSAWASGEKIDSLAPTFTPAYFARIWAIRSL